MNKWIGVKKDVINLRSLLLNYKKIIPKQQLPRFEKDLDLLFEKYQVLENEQELEKIKKLAKTKLNSMIRVYGELKEDETTVEKEFLDDQAKNFAEQLTKENTAEQESFEYGKDDYTARIKKLKETDFFNKDLVSKVHKDLDDYQNLVLEAQKKAEEKINEDLKKDFENNRKGWVEKYKERLKNMVTDLCVRKEVSNIEQTMSAIDFDKMAQHFIDMELNPEKYPNEDKDEKLEDLMNSFENILSGSKKTEDLFVNFRKNSINEKIDNLSKNEDLKTFLDQKLDKIKNDEKMTVQEKAKTFIKEQWKAENDAIKENLDGEIRVNAYGNLEFDFFKDSKESDNASEDSKESNDENTGVKTYHWKDGKLVEGKAKQRQTTTYSNWHSGNVNPDDLKRQRSLLDRQHYSGPLWDGIKPKSIVNDPTVFLDIEEYKNKKPSEPILKMDTEGKHEWEEIVR